MSLLTKDKSFYRSIAVLAVPVALQNLITFLVTFADNLMVSPLGDAAVSGVYMGGQVQTLLQMITAGTDGAIVIIAAQYWGKRDVSSIKRIASIGMHFALAAGAVLTVICAVFPRQIIGIFTSEEQVIASGAEYLFTVCFSYPLFCITQSLISTMRSVETARLGMYVSAASLLTDVALNFCLIEGRLGFPAMGTKGAALATLISRAVECMIIVIYVLLYDKKLGMKLSDYMKSDRVLRKDFIKYGLPIIGGQVIWSVNLMGNSIILGHFSESVISGASVANTMNSLAYVTINGMSGAVGIITGKTIGAGKTELMKEYARTVQILFLALGFITGGAIALIKAPFVALYSGVSAEAAGFATQFITVLSVTMIGTGYQAACLFGLVKSGGDVSFVFKNDAVFVLCVVLPSAIIASRLGAPAWVVYACLKCDQILKCFVAVVKINSFNWIKNLTRDEKEAG